MQSRHHPGLSDKRSYPHDILLRRRTNIRWDSALRQAYAGTLLACLIVLLLLPAGIYLAKGLSPGEPVLAFVPFVGAIMSRSASKTTSSLGERSEHDSLE